MGELELLLLRLEDLQESAETKEVMILAKALNRYFKSLQENNMGFKAK